MKPIALLLGLLTVSFFSFSQSRPFVTLPTQLNDDKFADWIVPAGEEGVFFFRKELALATLPEQFIVHTSADARYRLYINGQLAVWGPAVGDLENWNYETTDIAPFLRKGKNVLAAQVWNMGRLNGHRQQSHRTAFILQGDTSAEHFANTGSSWKVQKDEGYFPLAMGAPYMSNYIAGATDSLVAARHPWGWNQPEYNDSDWPNARSAGKGNHTGLDTWKGTQWKLKPREIPPMEQKTERIPDLLEVKGMSAAAGPMDKLQLTVPANRRVELLLDNRVLTMGFPRLLISGGKNAKIKIQYQEALFNQDGTKGNRNEWLGKTMKGYYDVFVADGEERMFEPLWVRVYRYVKITLETQDEPLQIQDFHTIFTAFPLEQKGAFQVDQDMLNQIWDASWRTLRLCALETYMDCPYYEQVQYIGDTRIQALISMYVAGEDRLVKNAILQFYQSMQSMGLTKSAHPTDGIQIIPPFSLYFIGMVHDFYMLRDDPEFIRQFLPGIKFILEWFNGRVAENGILGPLPYWNHIDNGTGFVNGSPPGISEGGSAHLTLLFAYALDKAAELLNAFDDSCDAERFTQIAASLKQKTMELCYCDEKQLIAETPAQQVFSQHTNIFALLTDTFHPDQQQEFARRMLTDKSLIQTTLYFKFYLFQGLKKAGLGGMIPGMMEEWKTFLDHGLTTFPEHGINSRSDCHAWSAHPMYSLLNVTCGISPASPGFITVEVRPAPGNLTAFNGKVSHPAGDISVMYNKNESQENYVIRLPQGLTGNFVFQEKIYPLKAGENTFQF
ncbi:MAG: alpha-L-rhamnosidase C-terminal domain-containing protein [Mariniphaga sp.]|nr:alpha-L-rhamnosidase C-terminal domain-containing protein [Mariniphaga sp.]